MKTFLIYVVELVLFTYVLGAQTAPKAISNPDPVYPSEAAELGYAGTVKVAIKIDKKGQTKVLQVFGPNAPCSNLNDGRVKKIRKAVVDAASLATFEPVLENGKAKELEVMISYSFDLNGKPIRLNELSGSKGQIVNAGVLQGRVRTLARPDYPSEARANRASGAVPVTVLVDTDGRVIAASVLGGPPVLQESAVNAACRSTFEPVQISGVPVQVSGVITFTFVA